LITILVFATLQKADGQAYMPNGNLFTIFLNSAH